MENTKIRNSASLAYSLSMIRMFRAMNLMSLEEYRQVEAAILEYYSDPTTR